MKKITEKGLLEEFAQILENSLERNIVKVYLEKFSIEDVENFIKDLIPKGKKEDET